MDRRTGGLLRRWPAAGIRRQELGALPAATVAAAVDKAIQAAQFRSRWHTKRHGKRRRAAVDGMTNAPRVLTDDRPLRESPPVMEEVGVLPRDESARTQILLRLSARPEAVALGQGGVELRRTTAG
ncbi:hypothetical protein MAPG_11115 [Magnaporthiopsis poae ATCC 64411]|uniref:Uncharacterized protein n=1 Tax=Magnaporthiopsis poae (strain ATCC 64411 / 73-15) TaxID=644358 RepID=A0A0C4EEE2_MAGP6|nr:hypothetical protein MAPG_11115 [Magnaporthiopsis poae ATCC 64411]